MSVEHLETDVGAMCDAIAALALDYDFTVAVAESLTGGRISTTLAAAGQSGRWFAGSIVSYMSSVKVRVLGVPRGPVVTEPTVRAMASGVADLMDADAVVAASGVGGPVQEEGKPPGTVWLAVLVRGRLRTELHHFAGTPLQVLAQTEANAVRMLLTGMRSAVESKGTR